MLIGISNYIIICITSLKVEASATTDLYQGFLYLVHTSHAYPNNDRPSLTSSLLHMYYVSILCELAF